MIAGGDVIEGAVGDATERRRPTTAEAAVETPRAVVGRLWDRRLDPPPAQVGTIHFEGATSCRRSPRTRAYGCVRTGKVRQAPERPACSTPANLTEPPAVKDLAGQCTETL